MMAEIENTSNPMIPELSDDQKSNHMVHDTESNQNPLQSSMAVPTEDKDITVTVNGNSGVRSRSGSTGDALKQGMYKAIEIFFEKIFRIKQRNTTINMEIYCGVIQFISCLYVLPVVPQQMARASYDKQSTIVVTAGACAIGCIVASVFTNLPFIIAPPTSVSIFLAVYLQKEHMTKEDGNLAVVLSGVALVLIGYRPFGRFVAKVNIQTKIPLQK